MQLLVHMSKKRNITANTIEINTMSHRTIFSFCICSTTTVKIIIKMTLSQLCNNKQHDISVTGLISVIKFYKRSSPQKLILRAP